ncbi:PREDICTED: serine/arginine-rich SC35-like splicing factor SCL30 [Tarenaya hassleriana]|uniref:serine/arginine-rich SC35-like splicing factor SCL30 n=1 Tax=Tarenaya hassleriana TaxID=28532 RepID=UPI00053C09D4|nr:PREDICTED: serine/arginine-rich SC35-like splicing factor SCL30 [Tarenaya hassleriana]XP_010531782.1 PREDICTED: serine/arginine-rich SC35-like splicing factor SCL30 [Tarenaya hassleriana]XP_019058268.1 PREDICTED: serine/arginine-rich SC35-like splicing factor SCL30 [Tarenaya hassleriana]
MRRYSPPYYSPPRRGYGGRGRSPPPRRGYGGRKGSNHGSLLVRNIPLDCRPEELRVPFERFGPVRDIYIPRDYYSGEPRGFAFVEFVDSYDAAEAQWSMNKRIFAGREITVVVAAESRKRPEEMRVKTRTTRGPSSHGGRSSAYYGRSRSRSASHSRSPLRPSDSRSRYRSRSYSPAPRQRADYSASPRRKQEEHQRSPPARDPTREENRKYNRRSYSPGYDNAVDGDRNGDNEYREKSDYGAEERRREWNSSPRKASKSPSGSRSRSADLSPR